MKRTLNRIKRLSKLKPPYFLRAVRERLAQRAGKQVEIDTPALMRTLERTKKTFRISFTSNGEPFLVPNLVEALLEISKKHYVNFCTNLVTGRIRDFLVRVSPEKVPPITASLHVKALEKRNLLNAYMANYKLAEDKGIVIINQIVAYPPFVGEVEKYKTFFEKHGMAIQFSPFSGIYRGCEYPDSYTEDEIERFDISNTLRKFSMKGKVCNAGYNVATVSPAGNIQPCTAFDEYLGNVYYVIKFDNRLRKCPVDYCCCPLNFCDPLLFEKALKRHKNPIRTS